MVITPGMVTLASLVCLLLAVFFVRIPVGILLGLLGFAGYAAVDGFANARIMLGNEVWGTFSSTGLTVIPFFVLMGQICFHSGLCERLYQAVAAFVGHKRGGVAAATLVACGGFSAICGSNTATAATMSVVALPEMKRFGYNPALAGSIIATGTTLGVIIPPSVVAIVLGLQTGISTSKLFIGGILPGVLLLLFFITTVIWLACVRPHLAPAGQRMGRKERIAGLPGLLETAVLFLLVVMGMALGVFTPTEAGAAGSALALILGVAWGKLRFTGFCRAVSDTAMITAMIFLLLAGANVFGKFMVITRVPFEVAAFVQGLEVAPWVVLLAIFAIYFVGGMFMDALALLLITLPVFAPLMQKLGIDGVWFCLMLMVVTTLGAITPPVGASAFVVASMGRLPLAGVFRGTLLFIPAFLLCLALMMLFPEVFLFLPNLAG